MFRVGCSNGGVLFSSVARATCGFPFHAGGFRYLEELVAALGGGQGGKDRIVWKGMDGRGVYTSRLCIPLNVLSTSDRWSRAVSNARQETGLDGVLVSRSSSRREQLRFYRHSSLLLLPIQDQVQESNFWNWIVFTTIFSWRKIIINTRRHGPRFCFNFYHAALVFHFCFLSFLASNLFSNFVTVKMTSTKEFPVEGNLFTNLRENCDEKSDEDKQKTRYIYICQFCQASFHEISHS